MNKKNNENNVHLRGFIEAINVRSMNGEKVDGAITPGRHAINFAINTIEQYGKADDRQRKTTRHNVVLFTEDMNAIAKYVGMQNDLNKYYEAFRADKDTKEKKPIHTLSLDGFLVPDKSQGFETVRIIVKEDSMKLDAKAEKNEVSNSMTLKGNIGNIDLKDDYAVVQIAHNFPEVEGKEKREPVWLDVRVSGNRNGANKEMFDALKDGSLKKGDFVVVGGQLHNRNYEVGEGEEKKTRYDITLDLSRFQKLERKEGEKVEVKEEAKKAETKKTAPKKIVARQTRQEPAKKVNEKKTAAKKAAPKKGISR